MFSLEDIRLRRALTAAPRKSNKANWMDWFGCRQITYFSYARYAMVAGLQAVGLSAGSRVLLPGYICFEVEEELIRHGFRTDFYPVDANFKLAVTPDQLPAADAIVVINYFGFATDLQPFRQYARDHSCPIMEDNSHGLLSRDANGHLLGTRGDLGILCMRKTFPLRDGAALVINNSQIVTQAPEQLVNAKLNLGQKLRTPLKWLTQHVLPVVGADEWLRRWYLRLKNLRRKTASHSDSLPPPYHFAFAANPSQDLQSKLASYDLDHECRRRRKLYLKLAQRIHTLGGQAVFGGTLDDHTVPFALVFRMPKARCEPLLANLRRSGLNPQLWPVLPRTLLSRPQHYQDVWFIPMSWQ